VTRYEHHVSGCRPEPLASYLKALGVFRLVGEQADPTATGLWAGDGFIVDTELSRDGLTHFFLADYRPTPIVSPWNSSSGFGPEGRGELQDIEASSDDRLAQYRRAVVVCRDLLDRAEREGWQKDKELIVMECRSLLPDECLVWLDAAVVLTPAGPAYPPLLGSGGNIGRFELSRNFHNRVLEVLGIHRKLDWDNSAWLVDALFGLGRSSWRRGESPSQFDPGAAGAPTPRRMRPTVEPRPCSTPGTSCCWSRAPSCLPPAPPGVSPSAPLVARPPPSWPTRLPPGT
jgi:CRISPR-associated protein Csx17